MLRSLMISILVVAFFNFSGCYTMHDVDRKDFSKLPDLNTAIIITKSSEKYKFEKGWYTFKGDTLIGIGTKCSPNTFETQSNGRPFTVKIPLNEIDSCKVAQYDGGSTFVLLAGTAGVALIMFIVIAAVEFENKGCNLGPANSN